MVPVMTSHLPDRLSLPEAARVLGVSERSVRRWVKDGTLPAERLTTQQRHIRIARSDVEALLVRE